LNVVGPFEAHVEKLRARYPAAQTQDLGNHGALITLPGLGLPSGWNKASTVVRFLAPVGYPFAKPDCFWADSDLRLASGALPQSSNADNPVPGIGASGLWFSWHTDQWNASRDNLLTWIASIQNRLLRAV